VSPFQDRCISDGDYLMERFAQGVHI